MKEKFLAVGISLLIVGIFLSPLSNIYIEVFEKFEEIQIGYRMGSNRIGVHISTSEGVHFFVNITNEYFVNKSGDFLFGDYPQLKVYNQKEEVVFSYPIDVFPENFYVAAPGFYTVVLENVDVTSNAVLRVWERVARYVNFFPYPSAYVIGSLFGWVGIGLSALGVLLLLGGHSSNSDKITGIKVSELQRYIKTKALFRVTYAPVCFFITFLTTNLFIFPYLSSLVSITMSDTINLSLSIITSTLSLFYWIFINRILRKIASRICFRQFLFLAEFTKKLAILMLVITFAFLVVFVLLLASSLQPAIFMSIWYTWWTIAVISLYVMPFIDPFSLEGNAILSLKQFTYEYKKSSNADFGLLSFASTKIAELIEKYNVQISSHLLVLGITYHLLKGNKDSLVAISKALKSIPKNPDKLLSILEETVSVANSLESRGLKAAITHYNMEQILRFISYIVPVVAALATIIKILLG